MTAALATKDNPAKDAAGSKDTGRTKSPEAFRTISEVAGELDVPQHVLRFWESRFAQVRPVKRAGGRRYYRPEDVDLLRGIRALLYHDGLTIKGVQKVLRDQGLRYVAEIGRGEATLIGPVEREKALPVDDEPRYARAAFAVLERALPEAEAHEGEDELDRAGVSAETIVDETVVKLTDAEIEHLVAQEVAQPSGAAGEPAPGAATATEPGLFDDQYHVNGQAASNAGTAPALDAAQRASLELLLSDLVRLKSRIRAARERVSG